MGVVVRRTPLVKIFRNHHWCGSGVRGGAVEPPKHFYDYPLRCQGITHFQYIVRTKSRSIATHRIEEGALFVSNHSAVDCTVPAAFGRSLFQL